MSLSVEGGSGLGLAIVAAITSAHGGRIDVTSVPGLTEFTIELPAALTAAPTPTTDAPGVYSLPSPR